MASAYFKYRYMNEANKALKLDGRQNGYNQYNCEKGFRQSKHVKQLYIYDGHKTVKTKTTINSMKIS